MRKVILAVVAIAFAGSAAYAADAPKKCCCDKDKMDQPAPKK